MSDRERPLGKRPLTNPEVALSGVLGVVLPIAGLMVVALAITSTIRYGQRNATIILAVCFVWGAAMLALLLSQV